MIGPDIDIPAPDMGTNAEVMAWIMNQYQKYHGFNPACVTGKPVELYGIPGREEATGRGVGIFAVKLLSRLGASRPTPASPCKALATSARTPPSFSREADFKLVAISDFTGGYYRAEGLKVQEMLQYARAHHFSLAGYTEAEKITNEQLLELDVEMLVPAALGGVITAQNARAIKAPIIIEAANGPVYPDADEIFDERGTVVLPDILANAGGVTVSYFEWVQNRQHYQWGLNRVRAGARPRAERKPSSRSGNSRPNAKSRCGPPPTCWASAASAGRPSSAASPEHHDRPVGVGDTLEKVPLFAPVQRNRAPPTGRHRPGQTLRPGELIVRQGKSSQNLWVVLEGKCEVVRYPDETPHDSLILAMLEPYSHFGEMSFFSPAPHWPASGRKRPWCCGNRPPRLRRPDPAGRVGRLQAGLQRGSQPGRPSAADGRMGGRVGQPQSAAASACPSGAASAISCSAAGICKAGTRS